MTVRMREGEGGAIGDICSSPVARAAGPIWLAPRLFLETVRRRWHISPKSIGAWLTVSKSSLGSEHQNIFPQISHVIYSDSVSKPTHSPFNPYCASERKKQKASIQLRRQ